MNQSIIEHKANYFYVEFREDYLEIAKNCTFKKPLKEGQKSKASAHCKALILSILEGWTNTKRGQGNDLAVYMSYPQWERAMYRMFSRSVIIDSLEELIGEGKTETEPGLIEREECVIYGRQTFRYILNHRLLNGRMKALPERDPHCTHPKPNGDDPSSPDDDPSKSRRDPSKNTPVASTNGRDSSKNTPATRSKVNASHVKGDDNPSKSRHNIESYTDSTQLPDTDSTERGSAAPTSSQPDATSFIHASSNSSISQGDTTNPPAGVEGVPSGPGGGAPPASPDATTKDSASIHIALPDDTMDNGAPTAPPGNRGAVVPKTETVDETIASIDQLRFWLKELGIYGSSDATQKAADLAEVLPFVHCKEDVISLHTYAETELFKRYGEYRKAFLGNMARGVRDWIKSRADPGDATVVEEEVYMPSPQGMDLIERDQLTKDLFARAPFVIRYAEENRRHFIAIFDNDTSIIELGDPDDLRRVPPEWLKNAEAYGASYWRRQLLAKAM